MQRALFYDFHHECLVYFAIVWAGALLIQERYRLFLAAALLAALTREDALLHVFARPVEPETLNVLARRSISASDFSRPGRYEELSLPFNTVAPAAPPSPAANPGPLRVELRIVYRATADLWVDRIEIGGLP